MATISQSATRDAGSSPQDGRLAGRQAVELRDERIEIGTLYKQINAFEAKKRGAAIAAIGWGALEEADHCAASIHGTGASHSVTGGGWTGEIRRR